MFKKIVKLEQTFLIGQSMRMSINENLTQSLWQKFMPMKRYIKNSSSTDLYSMQVYDQLHEFKNFDPAVIFTKWAAVQVQNLSEIPEGLDSYVLQGGLYAVFIHKGVPEKFPITYAYIFEQWLPNSMYQLDHREQFELLPENYRPNNPDAMEEIWIPIVIKPNQ